MNKIKLFIKHHKLNRMTMRKRLMLFFLMIIIIPLGGISIVNYLRFSSYTREVTIGQKFETVLSAMEGIRIIKQRDEIISNQILANQGIQELLLGKKFNDSYENVMYERSIVKYLCSLVDVSNIQNISVIGENQKSYSTSEALFFMSQEGDLSQAVLTEEVQKSEGQNFWFILRENIFMLPSENMTRKYPCLYVVRKLSDLKNPGRKLGYSILQVNYNRIYTILSKGISSKDGEISLLMDEKGTILCHTGGEENVARKIDGSIWENMIASKDNSFFTDINGKKYLMLFTRDPESGWSILQEIPYRNILDKSKEIRNFTINVMIVCLIVVLIMAVILSGNITKPILSLSRVMDRFGTGDLNARVTIDRADEIGRLQESFNFMTESLRNLLKRVENENRKSRTLELKVLEYQINPHFLYNTLDTVNWMAFTSGQKEIGEIVNALAKFFRISLSKGKEFIKLKDEIEHANSYLTICKIRYKDCFEFRFDIDEQLFDLWTTKLILQPVIENSIKHGIDKDRNDGLITITGGISEGSVVLKVSDNGIGLSEKSLQGIIQHLNNTENMEDYNGGIGLINVNQRIKLKCGNDYGVTISSCVGRGTTVTIKIPLLKDLRGQEQ